MATSDHPPAPFPSTQTITLPDSSSRVLSFAIYGLATTTSETLTIFYFPGFPGSHHEAQPLHALALARSIRLVAVDRPGMNESTFQPGRAVLDWPADVLALADHPLVAAPRFAVLGMSGGGPYVLACCRSGMIPEERLLAAGVLAGMFPATLGMAGMLIETRAMLWLAPLPFMTGMLTTVLDYGLASAARDFEKPERLEALLDSMMEKRPDKDARAYKEVPGMRKSMIDSVRAATGVPETRARGAAWEAKLLGSHWGFELDEIPEEQRARLTMWHGTEDVNVPVAMARKAAEQIKGVDLRIVEGETHLTLFLAKMAEALDVLKEKAALVASRSV